MKNNKKTLSSVREEIIRILKIMCFRKISNDEYDKFIAIQRLNLNDLATLESVCAEKRLETKAKRIRQNMG